MEIMYGNNAWILSVNKHLCKLLIEWTMYNKKD